MSVDKKLNIIEWCDQLVAEGKELKLVWDGGNDSGWVHFELDGEDVENEYTEALVDYMYDELDYGSWAGDFSAQGDAIYEPNEKAFVGTDYYCEQDSMSYKVNYNITIPKKLWFNELKINLEISNDDEHTIDSEFTISNGFFTEDHDQVQNQINEYLENVTEDIKREFESETGEQFDGVWENITIRPTDNFTVVEDNLIYSIDYVNVRYQQVQEKEIYLNVEDLQKQIDEEYD